MRILRPEKNSAISLFSILAHDSLLKYSSDLSQSSILSILSFYFIHCINSGKFINLSLLYFLSLKWKILYNNSVTFLADIRMHCQLKAIFSALISRFAIFRNLFFPLFLFRSFSSENIKI